jgi:hypothetical protein
MGWPGILSWFPGHPFFIPENVAHAFARKGGKGMKNSCGLKKLT